MNKPPPMSTSTNHLDKTIQNWVELDNELKKLNEKAKDVRTRKNDIEDKIITADAAFCHESACEKTIEQGGDFAFALKGKRIAKAVWN